MFGVLKKSPKTNDESDLIGAKKPKTIIMTKVEPMV